MSFFSAVHVRLLARLTQWQPGEGEVSSEGIDFTPSIEITSIPTFCRKSTYTSVANATIGLASVMDDSAGLNENGDSGEETTTTAASNRSAKCPAGAATCSSTRHGR